MSDAELVAKRNAIADQYSQLDEHAWSLLSNANVIVSIISNNIEDNSGDAPSVMYLLPTTQNGDHNPVVAVRGMFATLAQLLPDIVQSSPVSSSLMVQTSSHNSEGTYSSASQEQQQWLHVSYAIDADEILALPASRVSDRQVSHLVQQILRFLQLKHGSLLKAALGSSQDLNNVIGKLLYDTLFGRALRTEMSRNLEALIDQVPMLHLPDDIQFQVEDALNQFESSDFQDFSDDLYDLPREFVICGSCVFHRGHVIASHLCKRDLLDIKLWLKCTSVADLTREHPVRKIVLWQELHASDHKSDEDRRKFLLVSGLGHQLLGVILETGGCTANPKGTIGPDPFYVDQAVNTLEHLSEMGIPLVCEKWLTLPHNPSLLDIDNVISTSAKIKKFDLRTEIASTNPPSIVLKRTKSLEMSESSSTTSGGGSPSPGPRLRGDKPSDTNSSYEMSTAFRGDDKEDVSSQWELPRGSRRPITTSSIRSSASASLSSVSTESDQREDLVTYHVSKLTLSVDNTLIYFLHLKVGEGVFIGPSKQDSGNVLHLQRLLFDNFRSAVELIHGIFELSAGNQRRANSVSTTTDNGNGKWTSKSLVAIKEHGMLFRWAPSESLPVFSYWVCGRLFLEPEPKEVYVAYHESTPQQMVELCFRLSFGL